MGAGYPVLGEKGHEVKKERQLLGGQFLENRQHILTRGGGDEVVGVFDAGTDAGEIDQFTEGKTAQKVHELVVLDCGVDRHKNLRGVPGPVSVVLSRARAVSPACVTSVSGSTD